MCFDASIFAKAKPSKAGKAGLKRGPRQCAAAPLSSVNYECGFLVHDLLLFKLGGRLGAVYDALLGDGLEFGLPRLYGLDLGPVGVVDLAKAFGLWYNVLQKNERSAQNVLFHPVDR